MSSKNDFLKTVYLQYINQQTNEAFCGFSLNAEHDGSNNECKSTSSYIMAPYVGVEKGLTNPWVFSNCSIQYFADLIEDLDQ